MTATRPRQPVEALNREAAPINRTQIIDKLVREGRTREDAEAALKSILNCVALSLSLGDTVTIRNFGKFEPRKRAAVVRKNPVTGIPVSVPEKMSVGFVPAPALKERINQ